MPIYNRTELDAAIQSELADKFPDNTSGEITPADIRDAETAITTDIIDSLQEYGGAISGNEVDNVSITGTPTKWSCFEITDTSENEVLRADHANNRIMVKEPALYWVSVYFQGMWGADEDLTSEIRVNGITNVITPRVFSVEGSGANDPSVVSISRRPFIVNSAMITAGGGEAAVEAYVYSTTGTFLLDQTRISLGLAYNPLSINTVG